MFWAKMLADLIVMIHAAYVSFIVFGLALVLVGVVLRWQWVRNTWFRTIHLIAIGIVIAESVVGIPCPLTVWERELRQVAGQTGYQGDFIGYWTHRLLFYRAEPWVFTLVYVLFGLAVVAAFLLAPPHRFSIFDFRFGARTRDLNPQSAIHDSQSTIRNPRSTIRNRKSKIENRKSPGGRR